MEERFYYVLPNYFCNLADIFGIDYSISPQTEKVFMLDTLRKNGSPAIPMHMAIFNLPLKIALQFEIPLVVWGENSAFEYGDPS